MDGFEQIEARFQKEWSGLAREAKEAKHAKH